MKWKTNKGLYIIYAPDKMGSDEFLSSMNNELPWGNIHVHIKVIVHYTRKLKKYPNFVLNFRVVRFKSSDLNH